MAKSELAKKTTKQVVKIKKKKWCPILAPKFFGEAMLGESFLEDASSCIGRTIRVNLMQVTGDVKNQNADVKFEMTEAKESTLHTKIIGYAFSQSTIKRFMRRHMTRLDDSLVIMTKDNVKIRIKPFVLTRSKVSRAVEYTMRLTLREELMRLVKNTPYEALFMMVIKYQLQKEMKEKLSKVYPVKSFEIKILEEIKSPLIKETPAPVKKAVKKTKGKKEEAGEEAEEHPPAEAKEETEAEVSEEAPEEEKAE